MIESAVISNNTGDGSLVNDAGAHGHAAADVDVDVGVDVVRSRSREGRRRRMFGEMGSAADALDETDYELASRVLDALLERSGRDFSMSQIVRLGGVRADYAAVARAVAALVTDTHVFSTDRGMWSRYRFVWG